MPNSSLRGIGKGRDCRYEPIRPDQFGLIAVGEVADGIRFTELKVSQEYRQPFGDPPLFSLKGKMKNINGIILLFWDLLELLPKKA